MLHYSIPLKSSWIKDEPVVWRVCRTSKWVLGCITRSVVCSSGHAMEPLHLFLVRKYIRSFSATWLWVSYLRIPRKLFTWTFLSFVYSSVSKPFVHYHTHRELSKHFFPNGSPHKILILQKYCTPMVNLCWCMAEMKPIL